MYSVIPSVLHGMHFLSVCYVLLCEYTVNMLVTVYQCSLMQMRTLETCDEVNISNELLLKGQSDEDQGQQTVTCSM